MEKIKLEEIIAQEAFLTDKEDPELKNVFQLTKDLLLGIQCLESISRSNEVSTFFDSQILSGFFIATLSTIRRHTNIAFLTLRHVIENISLFVNSMNLQKLDDYKVIIEREQIIEYDEKIILGAYKFMETKYPEYSFKLDVFKDAINYYYSHANILSSQSNQVIVDDRIKALFFDSYTNDYINEVLLTINELAILMLNIYVSLSNDFKIFIIGDNTKNELQEFEIRHDKLKEELWDRINPEERIYFAKMEKIYNKHKLKYKDKLPPNYFN